MSRNIAFISILVIIVLASIGAYQFVGKQQNSGSVSQPPTQVQFTPTPSATVVPANWKSYSSETLGFSIKHPADMDIHPQQGGALLFVKMGPTQADGSGLSDGISLIFDVGDMKGKTLKQAIEEKWQEKKNDPITEQIRDIEEVQVGKYKGYKFFVHNFGGMNYIYLPKGSSEYLVIIDASTDPNNSGFNQTVNQMYSTLEIR